MADDQDDSQKTEEPTQKRLDEARQKGNVANSREINHWFMIGAATLFVAAFAPQTLSDMQRALTPFIESPDAIPTDLDHLRRITLSVFGDLLLASLMPLAVVVVAAIAGGFLQQGFLVSAENIMPKLEKISPMAGINRLFSARSIAEFAKGLIKLAIVGTVATMLIWPLIGQLAAITTMEMVQVLVLSQSLATRLMIGVLSVMTLIAGLDFLYQKFEHLRKLRMSRQELKDEYRQSEGDPMVKGRLRQIRMERARRRMMAAVPQADVVITNPTHYAVALKYVATDMSAPRLVAKGVDAVALKIREIAEANDVAVVENPPLARGLYAAVDLDQEIPPEHYKAVAEVIGYVMRLKRRMSPGRAQPAPPRPAPTSAPTSAPGPAQ
jgi:flagellar biosynthetic protein FlhB